MEVPTKHPKVYAEYQRAQPRKRKGYKKQCSPSTRTQPINKTN